MALGAAVAGQFLVGQLLVGQNIFGPTGVSSAQAFGSPTLKAGPVTQTVGGVPSAQAFGILTAKVVIARQVGGVSSAAAFGSLTISLHPSTPAPGMLPADLTPIDRADP